MEKLYLGDCFEVMKKLPDGCCDMVITDPPYEFKRSSGGGLWKDRAFFKEVSGHDNLDQKFDCEKLLSECRRLINGAFRCVIFCSEIMLYSLIGYAKRNGYMYTVTMWHKTNPIPFTCNTYLSDVEYAVVIRESGNMYGKYDTLSKVFESPVNQNDKKLYNHPTIKPVELVEKYIINHTQEGDTVLDMYMGSGTTGVACKNLNRNFIGIELIKDYYNTAKKRIENTYRQPGLFD